jgi:alpha-amylase
MPNIALYLKTHQPYRIKKYRVFDIGHDHDYFSDTSEMDTNNIKVLHKICKKSYEPTNAILLDLLKKHEQFSFSISLSGVLLDQLEKYAPDTLASFKKLIDTGRVEVLGETYYHSLSFFYSQSEFDKQVQKQNETLKRIFGIEPPKVFSNTELAYRDDLAVWAESRGYIGIIAEGWDKILGWRSPNFIYRPTGTSKIKLLLKNYRLSDDVAFRFSDKNWASWPLDADKYVSWLNQVNGNGETINLFMDYETFGEHQWEDTGIFEFLKILPEKVLANKDNTFMTVSQTAEAFQTRDTISMPETVTWADAERDLTAWTGNSMQQSALHELYRIEKAILDTNDSVLIEDWRRLQTSDHVYYMCTKYFSDGDVHAYFSPYQSPYEAFIYFMNALADVKQRAQIT